MLAEVPGPRRRQRGRGLGVLSDDFRRTVASSILKWVVSHQNHGRGKPSSRGEACDTGPGNKKGVCGARGCTVPGGCAGRDSGAMRPGWCCPPPRRRR